MTSNMDIKNLRKEISDLKKENLLLKNKLEESNSQMKHCLKDDEISQSNIKLFAEQIPDIVVICDSTGEIIFNNSLFNSTLKYSEKFITNKNISKLIHPEDKEFVINTILRLIKEKESQKIKYRIKISDGSYLWFESNIKGCNNYFDNQCAIIISRNINSLHDSIIKLSQSEYRFRNFLKTFPDLIFQFSKDGVFIDYFTNNIDKLIFKPSNFIGKKTNEVFPNYIAQKTQNAINKTIKSKKPATFRYIIHEHNKKKQFEVRLICDKENDIFAVVRDITEVFSIKNSLALVKKDYKTLSENNIDFIIRINKTGEISYVNKQFLKTFNINWLDYAGKKLDQLPIKGIKTLSSTITRISMSSEATSQVNIAFYINDKKHYFNWSIVKEPNSKNKIESILCIARDVTELKSLQFKFQKAKENAEESERLKTAFLANLGHEIRTPLNGIIGFSQMLIRPNVTSEKKIKYVEIIQKAGDQIISLINQIIDLSKIEIGQSRIKIKNVNIKNLASEFYELYRYRAKTNTINYLVNASDSIKDTIFTTDEIKLRQIVTNILDNAFKFTHKGEISLSFNLINNQLVIKISDTGIGIPEEYQTKIFDYFYQIKSSNTREYTGVGIGLSLVKEHINLLGGKLTLESKPDQGSLFIISLPLLNE